MIKSGRADIFFNLFPQPMLSKKSYKKAIFAAFNESLKLNELSVTIKIWHEYETVLTSKKLIHSVIESCVTAFEQGPDLLEPKIFLLMQLYYEMEYEQVDKLLTSMEYRFAEIEDDGSNQYLLCNLNPIKTACHIMMLLDNISGRYSIASLRTDSLTELV